MVAELSEQHRPRPNPPPASGGGDRQRNVRRTALWLALLAAAFYLGFIAMSVVRSH